MAGKKNIRSLFGKIRFNHKNPIQRKIRHLINEVGFDIHQYRPDQVGYDPLRDIEKFLHNDHPLIFDVGANIGQTVHKFKQMFPKSIIHSFEPSPSTFLRLKSEVAAYGDVYIWNYAIGSNPGQMTLLENSYSEMSSFLPLGESGWGTIVKETSVAVKTIDQICHDEKIEFIDILKSDTQGFDLEVFKGAENTFKSKRVGLVYFEVNFSKIYNNMPLFTEECEFLLQHRFRLVSFYRFYYRNRQAQWSDALFVHESYL